MQWLPVILLLPYLLLLLNIFRSLLKIKPYIPATDPSTFISVIVACRNEEEKLPALLRCLSDQNYPPHLFELIIVDDNSTDRSFDIATGYKGLHRILAIKNTGKGKKQAIRTGVNASSGNLIITTDADCRMGINWIRTIASFYEKKKSDLIICPVRIESAGGFLGKFQELEFLSLQGVTAGAAVAGTPSMCNGANLAFTKDAYLSNTVNLHDEIPSGDDIFLLHSIKKNPGAQIHWLESEDAMVITAASPGLKSFFKQRGRWISKAGAYNDLYTSLLGIATFFATGLQLSYMVAFIISPSLIWVLLTIFILKSIPDFLILNNTAGRYGRKDLMKWFPVSQIIYPFYVFGVVCYALGKRSKGK